MKMSEQCSTCRFSGDLHELLPCGKAGHQGSLCPILLRSLLTVLITTFPRVPMWVKDNGSRLGFTEGIQPEGMKLDEFPKDWLYNRQIPLEGHVPMAS